METSQVVDQLRRGGVDIEALKAALNSEPVSPSAPAPMQESMIIAVDDERGGSLAPTVAEFASSGAPTPVRGQRGFYEAKNLMHTGGIAGGGEGFVTGGDLPAQLRNTEWAEMWRSGLTEYRVGYMFIGSQAFHYVIPTRKDGSERTFQFDINQPLISCMKAAAMKFRGIATQDLPTKNFTQADMDVDLNEIASRAREDGGFPQ